MTHLNLGLIHNVQNALRRFLFGTLGVFTLGAAASWARVYCFAISGERLASHLRRKLHRALLFAKQEFFDTSHTGELTTLQEDIKVASSGVTTELSSGLRSLSTTATHTGMLLHLSPKLTVVAIAIIPVLGVGAMFYGRRKRKLAQELHRAIQKARVHAEECMANIKTVKTFGCEEKEAQRFERDTTQTVPYALRSCSADGLFMGGLSFATFSSLLLVIYFGGSLVKAGQLTVGKLTAFSMHASMVGLGGHHSCCSAAPCCSSAHDWHYLSLAELSSMPPHVLHALPSRAVCASMCCLRHRQPSPPHAYPSPGPLNQCLIPFPTLP